MIMRPATSTTSTTSISATISVDGHDRDATSAERSDIGLDGRGAP